MWRTEGRNWVPYEPRFVSDELDPRHAAGPWYGHRFFAYDLIRWGRPETIVELGTHFGVSLFAFCQAVRDEGYHGSLHAVDSWEGDPHAGEYGDEVLRVVEGTRAQVFPGLDVELHRKYFDDALTDFVDGSIDLLHIDGYHSYDAVKTDFETWRPKLAEGAVVLFHDVAKWTGYGSADFWLELRETAPSLTFDHSFGLGVLFPKGAESFGYLLGEEFSRWQLYYPARARAFLGELQFRDQAAMIDERDARILDLEHEAVGLRAAADEARSELVEVRTSAVARTSVDAPTAEPAPVAPPVSDVRRLLRRLLRLFRRGVRATNRHLGTNITILASGAPEIDDRIASVFDADFYLDRYPDVAGSSVDPLDHYRRRGWIERRDPSPLFWTDWYLRRYRDVRELGIDPLQHHLETGWMVGHDPSPLLRTRWYLDRWPDARVRGLSPLEHYWTAGYAEGAYANPEQRRRVVSAPAPGATTQGTVLECELLAPNQTARLVTLDALARADVDLVTFDIWDTLVGRTRPADAPKLATARRIHLEHAASLPPDITPWDLFRGRVAAEGEIAASTDHEEYLLEDVLTRHLTEILSSPARKVRVDAAEYARIEAHEECEFTFRIDELADVLERVRERPDAPKLAVLSDFYLGGDELRAVLEANGVSTDGVDVLVSCDVDVSKRVDGSLFELVRGRTDVAPDRHLHVGDNPWSDGDRQVATGGLAALVRIGPSGLPGPGRLDPGHLGQVVAHLRAELLSVVDVVVGDAGHTDTERRAAHAGVLTALLPVALVAAANEEAIRRGLPTVHYLSREGAFLARVHDVVAPVLAGALEPRVGRHVEVSRRSTFGASLDGLQHGSLERMWSQYADQSPRALFTSIGVPCEQVEAAVTEVGLSLDEVVPAIGRDERVAALLERNDVQSHIDAVLRGRRERLLAYLTQELDSSHDDLVVVDVGWRGTIQDNLAHLFPERRLHGFYLGLFPFLNDQLENVTKTAVAFDANAGDPFVHVSPPAAIEAPLTPDLPSPVDYEIRRDGRVVVVHETEGPRATAAIRSFQAGVLAAAPIIARWMVGNGFTSSMLRREINQMVVEYYGRPEGGVADIWFDSTHDDTFGALNVSPFAKEVPPRALLSRVTTLEVVPPEAQRSHWVPGYRRWLPAHSLEVLREMWKELH